MRAAVLILFLDKKNRRILRRFHMEHSGPNIPSIPMSANLESCTRLPRGESFLVMPSCSLTFLSVVPHP